MDIFEVVEKDITKDQLSNDPFFVCAYFKMIYKNLKDISILVQFKNVHHMVSCTKGVMIYNRFKKLNTFGLSVFLE